MAKNSIYCLFFLLLFLCEQQPLLAQIVDDGHFNTDRPYFKTGLTKLKKWNSSDKSVQSSDTIYPDRWKNESIVVLYHHEFIEKDYFSMDCFFRIRYKLNDIAAVEEFSTFSFSSDAILEIKIIKPDGKNEKVNLKTAVKEEIKFSNALYNSFLPGSDYKLALTDIEVGDILDISVLKTNLGGKFIFNDFLAQKYPISYLNYEIKASPSVQVLCISSNQAPKIKTKKVKYEYYYSFSDTFIEKRKSELKNIRSLTEPSIHIEMDYATNYEVDFGLKKQVGKVITELTDAQLAVFMRRYLKKPFKNVSSPYYYSFIKQYGYHLKDEDYFTLYYYHYRDKLYLGDIIFKAETEPATDAVLRVFAAHLKKRNIPYRFLILPSKYKGGDKNLLFRSDFNIGLEVQLPGKTYYISEFGPYSHPELANPAFEEQNILAFSKKDTRRKEVGEKILIPASNSQDNVSTIEINASFYSYPDTLLIKQTNKYTGLAGTSLHEMGNDYQQLIDDYHNEMKNGKFETKKVPYFLFVNRGFYKSGTSFDFLISEEKRKEQDFIKSKNEIRKKKWKESLEDEYDLLKLDTFIPLNNGRKPELKEVSFYSEFKIGGTLQEVKNNVVIDIGSVLGYLPEINLLKIRKNRKYDYFNNYNHLLKMKVVFQLPPNLNVQDISSLNKKLTNVAGEIEANASIEGKNIVWEINLTQTGFKHSVEEWKDYLALTDEVAKLTKIKLLATN